MITTRAVRMHAYGDASVLQVERVELPEPGPGDVHVRHGAVGVNFADVYYRTGLYPSKLPAGIGVEASGTVLAVGSGVTNVVPGDRVTYTGSPLGAYCDERIMPAESLIRLPDSIGFETAAAMTMRGLTSAYLLRRIWPLKAGDTVLFHAAAGGVGSIFCQWARLLGVDVIGTASSPAKEMVASANGCTHVVDTSSDDVVARVKDITGGRGVQVVYDGVGRDTFGSSLRCVARRGLVVCLGTASGPVPPIDAAELVRRGSIFVTRPAAADYIGDVAERSALAHELFDHVASGRISVNVNQRWSLDQAGDAHRSLESRSTTGSSVIITDHA